MKCEAIFDDIHLHIIKALRRSQTSITIAVAWFTDMEILGLLCEKASRGVRVELVITDDEINRKRIDELQRLARCGGIIYFIGGQQSERSLMHNKFCVIDADTVINGSYNWSMKARCRNHENVVITTGNSQLAQQFLEEFKNLTFFSNSNTFQELRNKHWIAKSAQPLRRGDTAISRGSSYYPKMHSNRILATKESGSNTAMVREQSRCLVVVSAITIGRGDTSTSRCSPYYPKQHC